MIDWYLERVEKLLKYCDMPTTPRKFLWFNLWISVLGAFIPVLAHLKNLPLAVFSYIFTFVFINIGIFGYLYIVKNRRAELAEEALPDYLLLFANNIKSGYVAEQAMMMSAKPEFGVLSVEVGRAVEGSFAGRSIEELLPRISERLDSRVISNTFSLIVEGVLSGGELPSLLEQTSYDVRRFDSVKRDVRAVISVYELFIASAAAIAAPILIGTSVFIVNVIIAIRARINPSELVGSKSLILSSSAPAIDPTMLLVFSFASIFVITFFASLAIGLIGRGKRVEGLRYFPILFAIAAGMLMLVRGVLEIWLGGLFKV